jgi:hypothetical protein
MKALALLVLAAGVPASLGLSAGHTNRTQEVAAGGGPSCSDTEACRRLAFEARDRGDFETFHDLAWRAVQKAPSDPSVMIVLARAQSLSGRPHDALVMIRRLAEKGVAMDVSGDDFRRVRDLPEWPDVSKLVAPVIAGTGEAAPAAAVSPRTFPADSMHFPAAPFVPGGLAYDTASARFVFSDSLRRKLMIVAEPDGTPQDLVREASAGFFDVTAIEIDHKRGDLWAVSARPAGTADQAATALHKLQLVSGRPLGTFSLPAGAGNARLSDIAVAPDGTILTLDDEGDRVYRLPPRGRALEQVASLAPLATRRLAPGDDHSVYVAHAAGLVRLDLASSKVVPVPFPTDADATNLTWIRAYRGSLVAMQGVAAGCRLVRLRMDRSGRRVLALEVLAEAISRGACPPATVAGDQVFYMPEGVSDPAGRDAVEIVIRRIPLN